MREFILGLWNTYSAGLLDFGRRVLIAVLVIVGGKVLISLGRKLINSACAGRVKLDDTIGSIMKMVLTYATVIICVIMILEDFGINTTGLIALLGTAGVAVGFALRDTLSNVAAGIVILFLKPFRKGDFIEADSFMGTVKEIGIFASEIETFDGIFISAPNSSLWGSPLKNYTRSEKRRMEISVRIPYTDSVDAATAIFQELANEESRFLPEPVPQVLVQSFGDYGVNVTLRAWVAASDYWPVYWDQMRRMKERIEAAGLKVPIPGREIKVIQGDSP